MSIQEHLNKIRNAVYGREVRESIAKGIETAYDDASEKDNANMEVKIARGTNPNLNTRLNKMDETDRQNTKKIDSNYNEVTAQLAQKANESDVFLKRHGININDLDEETINFIHDGTGGPIEINSVPKEGSVRPSSTNFAKLGKNKFEGDYLRNVALLGPTPRPDFVFDTTADAVVAIARIEPGEHWTVSKQGGNRFQVAVSDEYPKIGDRLTNYEINNADATSSTIYAETEKYLLVYVSNENEFPLIQVEKGQNVTDYEEPYVIFNHGTKSIPLEAIDLDISAISDIPEGSVTTEKIADNAVTPNNTTFAKKGKNLFDGNFRNGLVLLGPSGSTGLMMVEEDETGGYSAIVKVEPNTDYFISKKQGSSNRMTVGFGETYPQIGDELEFEGHQTLSRIHVRTGNNHHYLIVYLSSPAENKTPEEFQVELGTTQTTYEEPQSVTINFVPKSIPLEAVDFDAENESQFYIDDVLHGTYVPSEPSLLPYTNPWTADLETVYSIYDTLVEKYPKYVTRTLLGDDSSGLPIYRYDFKPVNVKSSGNSLGLPKIVVSHTHSFERQALLGGAKFWVDLCDNWKTNELLRTMRWNVHFIVVPVKNPYGLENVQRPNANGVDLARNFTAGWNKDGENGNPDGVTYAGESPLSEVETQLFNQLMEENKDAVFAIDVHNYTTLEVSNSVLWLGSSVPDTQKLIQGHAQKMSSYAQEKYIDGIVEGYENESLGFIVKNNEGGSVVRQWESKGVKSTILELVSNFGTTSEDVQYFSTAALGNLILTVLRELI